ncbi:hypothetical protein YpB42003004_1683 [Yersinia pestis biovar Antiqua str. B42003004]|nr:hypothetical protein YpB42003004_1683 [Yersinia pestis biovar Antiqua str. B42003004]
MKLYSWVFIASVSIDKKGGGCNRLPCLLLTRCVRTVNLRFAVFC